MMLITFSTCSFLIFVVSGVWFKSIIAQQQQDHPQQHHHHRKAHEPRSEQNGQPRKCPRQSLTDITSQELTSTSNLTMIMTPSERVLLWRYLSNATRYIEYGCGGSTELACRANVEKVVVIESDAKFLQQLIDRVPCLQTAIIKSQIMLLTADLGPTGAFGHPTNPALKETWHVYPESVLRAPFAPDLVLVDGRFRVASALFSLLAVKDEGFVMIHDFFPRTEYYPIYEFAEAVDCVENLQVFRKKREINWFKLVTTIEKYIYNAY